MANLGEFTIRPTLGLKTDVPGNDPTLFKGDACHCVEMQNVDLNRYRNASTKATGRTQYSAAANAQATKCLGLMELRGSAVDHLFWDNGKFYYLNSSREWTNVDAATPVTFSTADSGLICAIRVGLYAVMADRAATLTPYIWKNGDANLTKLIKTGTEYKFRFLAPWQRRIIGAYSDQTNGDIEIRWTQAWTESNFWASAATMAAGNQLYRPNDEPITGIKTLGANACVLYGENAIDSIDYFQNYTTPFAITNRVAGQGFVNHHSIVDVGGVHFGFNKNYGFCGYAGGAEFPAGGAPISYDIEDKIAGINPAYYPQIVGAFYPLAKECLWAVPLDGAATPNTILGYNLITKQWSIKKHDLRYLDFWTIDTSLIWNDLAALGYTEWEDFGTLRMGDLISSTAAMVHANTNGHIYTDTGESDAGSVWTGYRVEPVISLGETARSLLLEIWFGLSSVGDFSLFVYHRGGDTLAECEAAGWVALDEVSVNSPDNAVCYTAQNYRFHQLKWGTDAAAEPFSVNAITFKYVPQGAY